MLAEFRRVLVPEGVLVFRVFGAFFFGVVDKLDDELKRAKEEPEVLILRVRKVLAMPDVQEKLRELIKLNEPAVIDFQVGDLPTAFWLRFLPQVRKQKPANPYGLVKSAS
mgnify:CR=1 FL=1